MQVHSRDGWDDDEGQTVRTGAGHGARGMGWLHCARGVLILALQAYVEETGRDVLMEAALPCQYSPLTSSDTGCGNGKQQIDVFTKVAFILETDLWLSAGVSRPD